MTFFIPDPSRSPVQPSISGHDFSPSPQKKGHVFRSLARDFDMDGMDQALKIRRGIHLQMQYVYLNGWLILMWALL